MILLIKKTAITALVAIFLSGIILPKPAIAITIKKEEDLSAKFIEMVFQQYKIIKDPYIHNYVNKVGQQIVSTLPTQPFTYKFYVIKDNNFNAFAGPAGYIFINSGFLQAMENEEELAGILSHEIAHVACRHISGNIDRSKKLQLASLVGLAAGILLGIGGAPELSQAVTAGTLAGGQSAMLAYSREDETQADQLGMEYLMDAGYKGTGLLDSLKKIRNIDWIGGEIPVYLLTHPATSERIVTLSAWLETRPSLKSYKTPEDANGFKLAQTRLIALYGDTDTALKTFKKAIKDHPTDDMMRYGYGLALSKKGNHKGAVGQLKMALERNPFNVPVLEDLGRVYYLNGEYQKSIDIIESIEKVRGLSDEVRYFLGVSRMKTGDLENAMNTLEKLTPKSSNYTEALYALGEICTRQGLEGDAHYYLGKYNESKKDYKTAQYHLKKALKTVTSPEKKEEIHALLDKISKGPKGRKKNPPPEDKESIGLM